MMANYLGLDMGLIIYLNYQKEKNQKKTKLCSTNIF